MLLVNAGARADLRERGVPIAALADRKLETVLRRRLRTGEHHPRNDRQRAEKRRELNPHGGTPSTLFVRLVQNSRGILRILRLQPSLAAATPSRQPVSSVVCWAVG